MQANNPFVYHVPVAPANFFGREHILSRIFSQLRSPSRANVAIYGPLGIGKTSLLNYVSDLDVAVREGLAPETFLLCRIDCQSLGDFTPDRFWRRLLRSASRQIDGELKASVDGVIDKEAIGFEDIQDVLDDLEWEDRVLVALLDEFEWVVRTNSERTEQITRHFLGMLSSLGRRTPRVFSMVIATERPLAKLGDDLDVWRGSPFPTVFISQELPPFSREEADGLIERALAGTDVTFTETERTLIYEQSQGHPSLLQAAASALFDAKQHGTPEEDLPDVVKDVVSNGRANGSGGFSSTEAGVRLDDSTGVVWVEGQRIDGLTNKEYSLLRFLHANAGRVCPKEEIWKEVWPEYEQGMEDYPIQKLISRLRSKIEPTPSRPRYILTVWGRGYKFMTE